MEDGNTGSPSIIQIRYTEDGNPSEVQIWVNTMATIPHLYGTRGQSAEEIMKGKLNGGELMTLNRLSGLDLSQTDPYLTIPGRTNHAQLTTRSGSLVSSHSFQVFVKTLAGKSKLFWVKEIDSVKKMQKLIMQQLGYPIRSQNLIYEGRVLQDKMYLRD